MNFIIFFEQLIRNKYVQWAIIAFQIVLIIAIICIRMCSLNKRIKRIWAQYRNGEYEEVISPASELKGKYSSLLALPNKRVSRIYNQLSLIIASAALRIGNDELFYQHIKDVHDQELEYVVAMWLTVFDLKENDIESAKKHYEQFLQTKENSRKSIAKTFLDALFAYTDGNHESAIHMIAEIEQDLINPVMKNYVEDMIGNRM